MASDNRKRKNRLGKCDVCKAKEAIYTCPRCENVSCGLICVKRHKKELDCDGVRVRTKFISKDKLDEHSILSDYRLLEDIRRCVEGAERYSDALETFRSSVPDADYQKVDQQPPNPEKLAVTNPQQEGKNEKKIKKGNNLNKGDKNNSASEKTKVSVLLAKSKRIRQRALQQRTKKNANSEKTPLTGSKVLESEEDAPTKIENEPICPKEKEEKESKSAFSNQENLSASLELKKVLQTELVSSSQSDTSEVTKEATINEESLNDKESSAKQTAINAKLRCKILKNIQLGGKRREKVFEALQKAALTRGVVLNSLPEHFKRHWENTSFFFTRENLIYWHLRLTFLNAECYTLSLSECSEALTLESIIQRCFKRSRNFHRKQNVSNPLETYGKVGISNVSVLMTAERLRNSQRKFYVLDMKKTLKENFEGKCIVEFPQLCVTLKDCFAVSTVPETISHNFFDDHDEDDDDDFDKHGNEEWGTSKTKSKKKNRTKKKEKVARTGAESDRESGELTDTSDDDGSSVESESEQSEEELFQENEFRSIYKDLLKTFDSDVRK